MSESLPLRDRYLALIDEIVSNILKGKISSVDQIYQMLLKGINIDTGEVFELALSDRTKDIQNQVENEKDEIKKGKANRNLRAIKTIQSQWQRWVEQNQATEVITSAVRGIISASSEEKLTEFLRYLDPNQKYALNLSQLQQIAKSLDQFSTANRDIKEICEGISRGISSWQRIQENLLSWMYEQKNLLGFGGIPGESGPWASWAKLVKSEIPQSLFQTLAMEDSAMEFTEQGISLSDWVEVAIVLQFLQRGLVNWFDQQAYDIQAGPKLSISTFLTFAVIWSQLAYGWGNKNANQNAKYRDGASQIVLQILRAFAQRSYFPLYGGIFASFWGSYLRDALDYLDAPLNTVPGTQEKARILTLLGYSQRAMGNYSRSLNFHEQALEIARSGEDIPCEIANLNHLARSHVQNKNYAEAINYGQRALILSRQKGDKTGESNALVNLGYSEVMQARQRENLEPEIYESAINYLKQGLKVAEKLEDLATQSLCFSSLGIAHLVIAEHQTAIKYLEMGFRNAQITGDLYTQGCNLVYLSETYYQLLNFEKAVYTGSLGVYLLEQIGSQEWHQPAVLLNTIIRQIGRDSFQELLGKNRAKIISVIGVDGYDYIPELLERYNNRD